MKPETTFTIDLIHQTIESARKVRQAAKYSCYEATELRRTAQTNYLKARELRQMAQECVAQSALSLPSAHPSNKDATDL